MAGTDFFTPVENELKAIDDVIINSMGTRVSMLNESSSHLIKAGGKKLRPAFTLLCARIYSDDLAYAINMAAALEMIHISSLVHDDVIDNSDRRRGQATVKATWGNRVSIYTGNYTLAQALMLIAGYDRSDIVERVARASMLICEGEIKQMQSCYVTEQGMKGYLRRISRKTALLIALSCEIGAMIASAPAGEIAALKKYGYYLGMAFQITDDILDFVADEKILGKPVGSDIRQGVITLPALYAMHYSPDSQFLQMVLSRPDASEDEIVRAVEIILDSGGIDYAYECSCRYADLAVRELGRVKGSVARQSLEDIGRQITSRKY